MKPLDVLLGTDADRDDADALELIEAAALKTAASEKVALENLGFTYHIPK